MCGINGLVHKYKDRKEILNELQKMNLSIVHRGPDDDGFYAEDGIGMAMRRLAIIDLQTGKQPMRSNHGSLVIVFNGEIYNYRELRTLLLSENVDFDTQSDTEVILKLYEKYGTEAFSMLDGMFAFSIIDKIENKLFIARDFFGEKPLYYRHDINSLIWASELKSILAIMDKKPEISRKGLNLYFRLTYIPAPYSIYDDIRKLEANHFLEIDLDSGLLQQKKINRENNFNDRRSTTYAEEVKITHDLVMESVKSRSVSDVPVGTFLSGGVDSSIVSLALAKQTGSKINTFSIGFEKKSFDETDKSRAVATLINSNHHEFILKPSDMREKLHDILLNFDEPFADSSALPTYLVSEKTREHVTVALTGDGGDEVFGGYNKYYIGKLNAKYISVIPKGFHNLAVKAGNRLFATSDDSRGIRFKSRRLLNAIDYGNDFYYNIISLAFTEQEKQNLLISSWSVDKILDAYKDKNEGFSSLYDFRNIDLLLSLEGDMLVKVDRTSMLASLESRSPFLNKKLWDYTSSLPESYLMNGWNKKRILKDAFRQYFPEGFLDKSKKGFGVPVGDWLRDSLKKELQEYASPAILKKQGLFSIPFVSQMIEEHLKGVTDNTFRVWTFYCFQKWYFGIYNKSL